MMRGSSDTIARADPAAVRESDLAAARAGNERAFARLVEPLRSELHAHCYRMLGSVHDADDALQDALLRAWRGIARVRDAAAVRSWLYTISTRVCLDASAARARRALPMDLGPAAESLRLEAAPRDDVAWLTPLPDPEGAFDERLDVRLAFVAALQHLSGNQRAALLLFEVLGFSAAEIAEMLDTSVASVNSALARARRVLASRAPERSAGESVDTAAHTRQAARFAEALERGDVDLFTSLLADDVTWAMPPLAEWYRGARTVAEFAAAVPMARCGDWRSVAIEANGCPAVAMYLRAEPGGRFEAWSINVLGVGVDGDRITEITSFLAPDLFARFDLPLNLGR